ncbi:aspartyl-phosphate phosphatase Spo0E family protein [Heyndrickxia acidicola]|jgi:hypothetical protein|uniref:Aspartyl-phosphate phosphatase Spo0E family protein n=1 Tax=Heyndrickxia acidicola TaxID=209389 RepID=A0ABU6MF95_9BACI|nr:aspartyl-phosphate phosphatase Spo0E family protein [Heyndrickxia acidicola]MED1203336.1 aspartyl-phosphate phosphatase Spo0E family protein [Heyndrickxia acidicola]
MTILLESIKLKNEITQLRKDMMTTAQQKGFNDPETLKYSQEIDRLTLKFKHIIVNKGLEAS